MIILFQEKEKNHSFSNPYCSLFSFFFFVLIFSIERNKARKLDLTNSFEILKKNRMIQESNLVKTILKDEDVPRYANYYDSFVDHNFIAKHRSIDLEE